MSLFRCSTLIAVVASVALLGCATPEQRAERQRATFAAYKATCTSYGLTFGTPEHAACITHLYDVARQQQEANNAAALQWFGLSAAILSARPAPPPMQTCNTRWFAGQWITTCQ